MSTPIRFGGPVPQLPSMPSAGGVARSGFSTLLQTSRGATPVAGGISGRQVVAEALAGGVSPRSMASMVARAVGGPVGNVVAGVIDTAGQAAETLQFLDTVRNYILTNSIFQAANMPLVESELGR